MEMQAVSFGYARTPVKEGCPRGIANALTETFIFYHVRGFQVLRDDNGVVRVMIQPVDNLREKVIAFICCSFVMARQHPHGLILSPTPAFSARHRFGMLSE